jgi:transposase
MQKGQFEQEAKEKIRQLVREKERITQFIAKTKTEIKRIFSLLFPEIEKESSLFSQELLNIFLQFSSPREIKRIPLAEFIQQINKISVKGKGRRANLTPEKIYQLAASSIGGNYPYYEELLKMKINRLNLLLEEREYITKVIDKAGDNLFKKEIEVLTSIPGVGKESAIYLMAEILDIKRFESYRKLVGFCGLDPVIKQSGQLKASWRISKKGNAHARRIAWIMAGCVKRSSPNFRDYYLKKRTEGKSYKEAVIATSTKLLRVIYALLNENRTFV